jgi:drug/metabolite transporter (DMT)-like permease
MLYLLLTIVLNAVLFVGFKIFERFKIDNLQAIVVNYWVATATGSIVLGRYPVSLGSMDLPWLPWALIMGAAFISIFNLIAYCTTQDGVTTTTVANKLSMVIPAAAAIFLYGDKMSVMKGAGILLAFPAVYFSSKSKDEAQKGKRNLWIAALLFVASGGLDTMVNWVAHEYFTTNNAAADEKGQIVFLIHAFNTAAVIGLGIVSYMLLAGKRKFAWKNVLAGVLLGVPNFFSIYFFFRLLQTGFLPGSAAIPVNNIGIVLAASITAILFFKEKAGAMRIVGMALSIAAILLIMFSDLHGNNQ